MSTSDNKPVLGVITDEAAMYDLLAKFLVKEGYEVKRASHDPSADDDFALIVYAPTRETSHSKDWFDDLMKKKRAVLVVQCCDEDYVDLDDNVVVMSERPLNLRQLSNTIEKTIETSASRGTPMSGVKVGGGKSGK
ncbi:MAG: hypothetical protein M1469_06415 [Bacteroidetes bacterium]|nr:hypothetical protein [Bacteroidota bacterium]